MSRFYFSQLNMRRIALSLGSIFSASLAMAQPIADRPAETLSTSIVASVQGEAGSFIQDEMISSYLMLRVPLTNLIEGRVSLGEQGTFGMKFALFDQPKGGTNFVLIPQVSLDPDENPEVSLILGWMATTPRLGMIIDGNVGIAKDGVLTIRASRNLPEGFWTFGEFATRLERRYQVHEAERRLNFGMAKWLSPRVRFDWAFGRILFEDFYWKMGIVIR